MAKKQKLFIVDDEESMRRLLQDVFENHYDIVSLESAYKALEELDKCIPDIILTDIKMPGKDGLSLAKDIAEKYPEIPVIILTGHGSKEIAINAIKLGVFDFIEKPFEDDEIKIVVDRAAQFSALLKNNEKQVKQLKDGALELIRAAKKENKIASGISWIKKLT